MFPVAHTITMVRGPIGDPLNARSFVACASQMIGYTASIVAPATGVVPAAAWHFHMSLRVEARTEEDFADTLDRFSQLVQREYERPWTKRRYGYYEPPSALRRKRSKMRWLRCRGTGNLWLRIDIEDQLRRTGPINAAGR